MAMQWPVSTRSLRRFGLGGAWFFIVVSMLHLAWVYAALLPDPGGSTVKLYDAVAAGRSYDAVGLTYSGAGGVAQATFQALLLAGAIGASIFAGRRWRRAGHAVLVLWAGLWLGNLLWLAGIDHSLQSVGRSTVMAVLFACTVYRAAASWNGPAFRLHRRQPKHEIDDSFQLLVPDDEVDAEPPLTADDIGHSDAVQPLPTPPTGEGRWPAIRRSVHRFGRNSLRLVKQIAARLAPMRRRIGRWLRQRGVIPQPQQSRSSGQVS